LESGLCLLLLLGDSNVKVKKAHSIQVDSKVVNDVNVYLSDIQVRKAQLIERQSVSDDPVYQKTHAVVRVNNKEDRYYDCVEVS